ncbi:MAG: PilX N-terminal domain-containing pilus assembly protein [Chromatiales bacterium]
MRDHKLTISGLTRNSGMAMPLRQRGAVLIFSLIVLLIMTVLAISGMGNSTLEQRMAGNYSQSITAFQAAEQGLRIAEQWMYKKYKNDPDILDMDDSAWWFRGTSEDDGLYTAIDSHPDSAKVCAGKVDCEFNPRDEKQWCSDMANAACKLPKGFIALSDSSTESKSLYDVKLSSIGEDIDGDNEIDTVAKQPQFIIEYVGPTGIPAKNITLGTSQGGDEPPLHAFRVTVIAWGQDTSTRHVLQSHVVLPL